ncbi:hypothetical protein K2173_002982 [Erythroxylum novogranatense]|uniref:NAC domain-containing protein n=1 Tax=Erythroxylum novogranatense TaxID=1862640 RepID=A0AAV8S859_9ROSI|nr:hypothetical protein K2173_002982 [Erythroxylum novogranatense]
MTDNHDFDQYIINQLNNKFTSQPVLIENLIVADIRDYHPKEFFSGEANVSGVKERFVLTPRNCHYGSRWLPVYQVRHGYWEAFEYSDGKILGNFGVVGVKQKLRFCEGELRNGRKTNWHMIEYRLLHHYCLVTCNHLEGKLDDWVLCRVKEEFVPEDLSLDMEKMNI